MKVITKSLLLVGALAVAGCTDPGRFGGGAGSVGGGFGDGAGGLGSASDPRSPAYFQQTIGDRVLFAVDQSTLTPEAIAVLDGQAQWLFDNPEFTAIIEGHADEQGTRDYNIALGDRRANAVKEYLVSRGVPDARMRTLSYGKERPVATCSDESCYSQNRRAVTIISVGSIS